MLENTALSPPETSALTCTSAFERSISVAFSNSVTRSEPVPEKITPEAILADKAITAPSEISTAAVFKFPVNVPVSSNLAVTLVALISERSVSAASFRFCKITEPAPSISCPTTLVVSTSNTIRGPIVNDAVLRLASPNVTD